ncbi:MAG TPA: hypothetical protein PKL82_05175 [Anaerolineaceae bacterium]|nr:hypothetical protein [Anaerolineaceae bacterium]NMD27058.1 hypothetical protein [Chloroflexota bacterium]HOA21861.1 hypothetical protein [Anaerolineaceae bacterium]HOG77599.1 hypothetical protein [Anaerolineaceae bacterium]
MRNQKPVGMVKRRSSADSQSGIPKMARRKRGSCSSITIGIILMIIILIVLLAASGIIKAPVVRKTTPIPSPTFTSSPLQGALPSEAPESTFTATPTHTALPSFTPTVTQTPAPTKTPTPTATATEKSWPFVIRGTPEGLSHTLFHPEYACEDYLFIGGQVWDLQDAPLLGLVVRLGGTYGGDIVDMTVKSGSSMIYGRSGYEFALTNKQIAENKIYIQLEDESGEVLSTRTFLNVTASCQANLIIVNFKQVR